MLNLWVLIALWLLLTVGLRMLFEKSGFRKIIGFGLIGHCVNLVLLTSGSTAPNNLFPMGASFVNLRSFEEMMDPLPQALILTAIVIGFALTAFLLLYQLTNEKESKTEESES